MSPLAILLMKVLRAACWAAAGLMAVLLGVHAWKISTAPASVRGDYFFAAVMVVMFAGAVWLALAISRELRNNPPPPH